MKQLFTLIVFFISIFSTGQIVPTPVLITYKKSEIKWLPPCGERFNENGKLYSKCDCVGETIDGKYTLWNSNGIKSQEETFEMGTLKKKVEWYPGGRVKSVHHYYDKDHCYKTARWSPEGHKEEVIHFDWKGEYHGMHYVYFENGELQEQQNYEHGKRTGLHKVYSRDRRELVLENIHDGRRHGKFKKWHDGRLVEDGQYAEGEKSGNWIITDLEKPEVVSEIRYNSGEISSETKFVKRKAVSSMDYQSGKYIEFDPNGIKLKEWSMKEGKRFGLQREWDKQGKLVANYQLVYGRYCDSSIFYNADGTFRIIDWIPFENAKKGRFDTTNVYVAEYLLSADGDSLEQHIILNSVDKYKVMSSNSYVNNQKSGHWAIADLQSGIITKELTYVNGVLEGPFRFIKPGTIKHFGNKSVPQKTVYYVKGTYHSNLLEGTWTHSYTADSNEILLEESHYKNGLHHGSRTLFTMGNPTEYSTYENGELHGPYKSQWPGGRETMESGDYQHGEKHGFWKRHRDTMMINHGWTGRGSAYEGYYNRGVKEGYWKHYGPYGHLISEGTYVNDKPDGHWIFYIKDYEATDRDHPVKAMEGTLKGKTKTGIWKRYNSRGKLFEKLDFDKDPYLNEVYG